MICCTSNNRRYTSDRKAVWFKGRNFNHISIVVRPSPTAIQKLETTCRNLTETACIVLPQATTFKLQSRDESSASSIELTHRSIYYYSVVMLSSIKEAASHCTPSIVHHHHRAAGEGHCVAAVPWPRRMAHDKFNILNVYFAFAI